MINTLHTVLGANGIIGREIVKELQARRHSVRVASRKESGLPNVEEILTDLSDLVQTKKAIQGSTVVYLVIGLPYKLSIWQKVWPLVMQNVIDGCLEAGAKLVFFDNVYCYGKIDGTMTEETPIHPTSKKGEVRAELVKMMLAAYKGRGLVYAIGRSADFYGPNAKTGAFNMLTFVPVVTGKTPAWFINLYLKHSLTYTPDAGKAMVILGTDQRADYQSWHIPTAKALGGSDYIALAVKAVGGKTLKPRVLSKLMFRFLGLFVPMIRESVEMLYQNEFDYIFDSGKFERTFGVMPTSYEAGIAATVKSIQ